MAVWECTVCGWTYDEEKGLPEEGIAPGTRWEDIPDDWMCPECGVSKDQFEMVKVDEAESKTNDAGSDDDAPVVIVGTGLAGYNLAKEIRKLDKELPLLLITADDGKAYSKPMLSTAFTREQTADDLVQADVAAMVDQLQASIWTQTAVTAIDTQAKTLSAGDKTQPYRQLILASGAAVIKAPLEGDAVDKIFTVNDRIDYGKFRDAISQSNAKRVCLIGAGLIGSEFCNDLLNGGYHVDIIDPLATTLGTLLPEPCGKAVTDALVEKGGVMHLGRLAKRVDMPKGDATTEYAASVTLDDGQIIEADIVLSAIGVRPDTTLATAAGLDTQRGILVDRFLQSSAKDVYAIGDCAEIEGHVLCYVAPLMASARALAKTLVGEKTAVALPAMPVTIKTPACPVVVAPPPRDSEGQWQYDVDPSDPRSIAALFKNSADQLLGFALTGAATKQKLALQKQLPALIDA